MSNYNGMKLLISTYSGNERHITIPRIYLELTNDYPTAALLNQMIFWSDKTKRRDGFFYKTYKDWEEETFLSEYQVRRASKALKKLGFLETKLKKANGSPTLHYKLDMDVLSESIMNKLKNRNQTNLRNDSAVPQESLTVDDAVNDTVNDNSNINSPAKAEPPLPYAEIIDYLNSKAQRSYLSTTRKTRELIRARYKEGFSVDDFKRVIDTKTAEWKGDKEMDKFLRPYTLFGTKFEGYLQEEPRKSSSQSVKDYYKEMERKEYKLDEEGYIF